MQKEIKVKVKIAEVLVENPAEPTQKVKLTAVVE